MLNRHTPKKKINTPLPPQSKDVSGDQSTVKRAHIMKDGKLICLNNKHDMTKCVGYYLDDVRYELLFL